MTRAVGPRCCFDRCILRRGGLPMRRQPRECSASMAIPVPYRFSSGASRLNRARASRCAVAADRDRALRLLVRSGIACRRASDKDEPRRRPAPAGRPSVGRGAGRLRTHAARTLWQRSGKTPKSALGRVRHRRSTLDPHQRAKRLYDRGLLYQGEKQHQLAIDDFTAANGLTPQQAEPLLAARSVTSRWTRPRKPPPISTRRCRPIRRTRRSGPPGGLPMNASATRPRPPAHMAAPSTCAPRTKPREAALRASAASPARATTRSKLIR